MNTTKSTLEIVETVCAAAEGKARLTIFNNLILAFLAGAYIAIGSVVAIKTAGNLPPEIWGSFQRLVFGGVFPVGLLLVLIAGGDLFTGDCMFATSGLMRRQINLVAFARIICLSLVGNFAGSLIVVYITHKSGVLMDGSAESGRVLANYAVSMANSKTHLLFSEAFFRAIGCNWMVCLAIFLALACNDGVSKVAVLWPPVTAFVIMGFEHSVANMAFVPLGIFIGESELYQASAGFIPLTATWGTFFVDNLIPVILGNYVGGALFVSVLYFKTTGLKPKPAGSQSPLK